MYASAIAEKERFSLACKSIKKCENYPSLSFPPISIVSKKGSESYVFIYKFSIYVWFTIIE